MTNKDYAALHQMIKDAFPNIEQQPDRIALYKTVIHMSKEN